MQTCLLFGLFVVVVVFLVPQGAKLFHSSARQTVYKYILFTIYSVGVLWLTLVNRWGLEVSRYRFKPLYVVRQLLTCWFDTNKISVYTCKAIQRNSKYLFDSVHASPIEDLLLNIILFIPFGFLLPYIWPKLRFWKTISISFLVSVIIEATQYVAQLGCCDIDDIFNNTLGSCIGYACYKMWKYFYNRT